MGGNLFKLGRRPRAEYLVIEAAVREQLDRLLGGGYRIPRYYASKPDFGDLDVVVSTAAIDQLGQPGQLGGWDRFREAIAERLGVRDSKSVGQLYSTVIRDFQVDFFVREPELLDPTANYLAFNDLGNLIGKIYRQFGLKYGELGLSYVVRRDDQPSYKAELPISRDWPRMLGFLELDVDAWERGFEGLEEMFAWVVASPYFSVAPYVDERARKTEVRARTRPTMARFLGWLACEGVTKRYEAALSRAAQLGRIAAAFPEAGLIDAVAREQARASEASALRSKFDGELVRTWTGLEGKSLGMFMRRFVRAHPDQVLAAMDPAAIRAAVESFARADASEEATAIDRTRIGVKVPDMTERPTVIVTGGSAGIGLAIVRAFVERDQTEAVRVLSLARRRCPIEGVENLLVDLGSAEPVAAVIAKLRERVPAGGRIHLIHNAAVMPTDAATEFDSRVLDRTFRLNVTTPAEINAALIPQMGPGSSIVFLGSTLSEKAVPNRLSYVTSKHAVLGLMRATVQDLFGTGIHCVCVAPGFTDTAMLAPGLASPGFGQAVRDMVSFGRLLEPEEIAEVVVFATRTPALNGAIVHANLGQRER